MRFVTLMCGLALMSGLGCAPEITQVKPAHVARDEMVFVEGKHMSDRIVVTVGGGPIPTSELKILQKKDKIGRFSFRMPFNDVAGRALAAGPIEVTVKIGGTTQSVVVNLSDKEVEPAQPRVVQGPSELTEGPVLRVRADRLRWPVRLKIEPIFPHGEPRVLDYSQLRFATAQELLLPLAGNPLQLSSFRVYLQNSVRYGGTWSEPATAVYKPQGH